MRALSLSSLLAAGINPVSTGGQTQEEANTLEGRGDRIQAFGVIQALQPLSEACSVQLMGSAAAKNTSAVL